MFGEVFFVVFLLMLCLWLFRRVCSSTLSDGFERVVVVVVLIDVDLLLFEAIFRRASLRQS